MIAAGSDGPAPGGAMAARPPGSLDDLASAVLSISNLILDFGAGASGGDAGTGDAAAPTVAALMSNTIDAMACVGN